VPIEAARVPTEVLKVSNGGSESVVETTRVFIVKKTC
jgi:hypothetical protein